MVGKLLFYLTLVFVLVFVALFAGQYVLMLFWLPSDFAVIGGILGLGLLAIAVFYAFRGLVRAIKNLDSKGN